MSDPASESDGILTSDPTVAPISAPTDGSAVDPLAREALEFMASYSADLLAGNRDAVIDRYSRDGATFMGAGTKRVLTFALIEQHYREQWNQPASFEWCDLSAEVVGPEAVVVTGLFKWGSSGVVRQYAYTGLLVRAEGALRIRLEHEAPLPAATTPVPAASSA